MKTINKHSTSIEVQGTSLKALYQQTKELQLAMQAALQRFSRHYQSSLGKVKEYTDQMIDLLKEKEEKVLQKVDLIKDQVLAQVDDQWKSFKKFARHVRKICLGDQHSQTVSGIPLYEIESTINIIESKIDLFDAVVLQYQQDCNVFEQNLLNRELRVRVQSKLLPQQKPSLSHFAQISPIRPNLRTSQATSHPGLSNLDSLAQLKQSLINQMEKQSQRKMKTENNEHKGSIEQKIQQAFQKLNNLKKSQSSSALAQKQTQAGKSPSTKTIRSVIIPNIESIQQIESPKHEPTGKLKKIGNSKPLVKDVQTRLNSPISYTATRRNRQAGLTSQRRQEVTSNGGGYKNCLQRLQQQQFSYQKLRRGL